MSMPPDVRAAAEAALATFCQEHSSAAVADQLRYEYEISGNTALLIERRPSFLNREEWTSTPVAKFRYTIAKGVWTLHWCDSNERWHRVANTKAAKDVDTLLKALIADPTGVFWG